MPEVLNREVIDEIVPVEDEDAIETARLCARREGVNAGISGGRGGLGRRSGRLAPRDARKAHRRDPARLGRPLHQHAVLRSVSRSRPAVAREVREDLAAALQRDPAARSVGRVEMLLTYRGVQALLAHRVSHALHAAGVPLLPRSSRI